MAALDRSCGATRPAGSCRPACKALRIEPARVRDQPFGLRSCIDPVLQFVIRSRPQAVTPNLISKATAPLPILSLACEAAARLGASGVLIMPEGPMEWELVR